MENLVISRTRIFISHKNLSINALSKVIGMNQVTVNNYFAGNRKLSFEFVEKILATFPDLSAEWLLRGIGDMYL